MVDVDKTYLETVTNDPKECSAEALSSEQSTLKDEDEAIRFLKNTDRTLIDGEVEYPKSLAWKIDLRMMTLMCCLYFLQFIDKNSLNLSGVMGIKAHLTDHPNGFADLGTIFSAAYIVGLPFSAYFLQVFPISKVLSFCIISWGIVVACHAACKTYATLMVIRTLLGLFESALAPGLIIISSMWWNKKENMKRTGIWTAASGISTIVGSLLSFAFQHVKHARLEAWQIFFLVLGCITIVFGIVVFFALPDNPTSASFLTEEEKVIVLEHIRTNQTGTETKKFKKEQLIELLFHDKHTWPMFFLTLVSMISTGALGTWSVSIFKSFGFTSEVSSLIQMPIGAVIIISIIGETYISAYTNQRTLVFLFMCLPGIAGYSILFRYPNKGANLTAVYLNMASTCVITLIYAWNSSNTAGHTKKLARNALTMVAFSIASLIGPQLFRASDAPHYRRATTALIVLSVVTVPIAALVGYISKKENERRDKMGPMEMPPNYEFADMTDIENKNFRYSW
jgi:MFS family permease